MLWDFLLGFGQGGVMLICCSLSFCYLKFHVSLLNFITIWRKIYYFGSPEMSSVDWSWRWWIIKFFGLKWDCKDLTNNIYLLLSMSYPNSPKFPGFLKILKFHSSFWDFHDLYEPWMLSVWVLIGFYFCSWSLFSCIPWSLYWDLQICKREINSK